MSERRAPYGTTDAQELAAAAVRDAAKAFNSAVRNALREGLCVDAYYRMPDAIRVYGHPGVYYTGGGLDVTIERRARL